MNAIDIDDNNDLNFAKFQKLQKILFKKNI